MENIQEKVFRVHFKKVGKGTYPYMNLPISWTRENELEKGDSLLVTMDGDLHISPLAGRLIKKWRHVKDTDEDEAGDLYINDALHFKCPDCQSRYVTIYSGDEYRIVCHDCGAKYRIQLTDKGSKGDHLKHEETIKKTEKGDVDNEK